MEQIINQEQKKELISSAQKACHHLNRVVFPIARELGIKIDENDTATLNTYLRNLNNLRDKFFQEAAGGAKSLALANLLEQSAEELWKEAYRRHPILNPYALDDIAPNILQFIAIKGEFAKPILPAIEKACIVEQTAQNEEKRKEIKDVCEQLNRVFNGRGELLFGYIAIAGGRFWPLERVTDFRPLF